VNVHYNKEEALKGYRLLIRKEERKEILPPMYSKPNY
jgi:hypothetical protein